MSKRVDVYSMQIVVTHFKKYDDFLNVILVCKKYEYILDRIRMNPIQITPKTKNLFKFIQTQQFFSPFDMKLNIEKSFFNYPKCAKECLVELKNFNNCPLSIYTKEDQTYFNSKIPDFVRKIGSHSFELSDKTSLTLPNSVIEISQFAFSCCSNIEEIILPPHLMLIGENAFYNCKKLKEIKLPDLLEFIPDSCFAGCTSLSSVNFGTNVTMIGYNAFRDCAFIDFSIEKKVLINELVFTKNTLTKITFCGKKCIPRKI
ncbi:leucine rich repeat containing protein BspA family protein, partial [Entamoeba invadens IP1]